MRTGKNTADDAIHKSVSSMLLWFCYIDIQSVATFRVNNIILWGIFSKTVVDSLNLRFKEKAGRTNLSIW